MQPGQDITGPASPTRLSVTAHNGVTSNVSLSWNSNADSASFNIYRSPVQGGGYVKIGSATGTSFTDSSVNNGPTYYYVVRGVDALSNEVSHIVQPKVVQVAFRVKVPAFTPPTDIVYISGLAAGVSPDPLCGYCGGGTPGMRMTETAPGSHMRLSTMRCTTRTWATTTRFTSRR